MQKPIRIVVGYADGDRASAWRIWFGPADLYVGFRDLSGSRKASIHFPRETGQVALRYVGFTRDFASAIRTRFVPRQERTHLEWKGAEIAPGYVVEFRLRVPRSELRPLPMSSGAGVTWVEPGPPGTTTEVAIVSGPPAAELHLTFPEGVTRPQLLAETQLPAGKSVWVLSYNFVGPSEPELLELRRTAVQAFAVHGRLPHARANVSPTTRVNLTFEADDGSAGEWELSGDFLAGT